MPFDEGVKIFDHYIPDEGANYSCPQPGCDFRCAHNKVALAHMRQSHNIATDGFKDFEDFVNNWEQSTGGVKKRMRASFRKKVRPKDEKPFPCPAAGCTSGFKRAHDLDAHLVKRHWGEKVPFGKGVKIFDRYIPNNRAKYGCPQAGCDFRCGRNDVALAHLRQSHDIATDGFKNFAEFVSNMKEDGENLNEDGVINEDAAETMDEHVYDGNDYEPLNNDDAEQTKTEGAYENTSTGGMTGFGDCPALGIYFSECPANVGADLALPPRDVDNRRPW